MLFIHLRLSSKSCAIGTLTRVSMAENIHNVIVYGTARNYFEMILLHITHLSRPLHDSILE